MFERDHSDSDESGMKATKWKLGRPVKRSISHPSQHCCREAETKAAAAQRRRDRERRGDGRWADKAQEQPGL